jgi:hypothetical protein
MTCCLYKQGQTMDDAIHIYNNNVDLGFLELLEIDLLSGEHILPDITWIQQAAR